MGYTHYWTQNSGFTGEEWDKTAREIQAILDCARKRGVALGDGFGKREITAAEAIQDSAIVFNGLASDSHETFYIHRALSDPKWDFCKTARKPYDVAVTACLIYLDSVFPGRFSVSSDGTAVDWQDGLNLARSALPHIERIFNIPAGVHREDVL